MMRPPRDTGRDFGQPLGNVFVGQAMEAVSPHAVLVEGPWQGVAIRMRGVATMEGRVETGDLRNIRIDVHGEADRREVVRLVQRRKFLEGRKLVEDVVVDQDRFRIVRTAVDDAVADGAERETLERLQPGAGFGNRRRQVVDHLRRIAAIDQHRSVGGSGHADAAGCRCHRSGPRMQRFRPASAISKIWNLRLDEPALTTRIASMLQAATCVSRRRAAA